MAVSILIPMHLRRYLGGADRVEVPAKSATEALIQLAGRHPELRRRLYDDGGRLRDSVHLRLGETDIRDLRSGEQAIPLKDGDVLTIAITGGAAPPAGTPASSGQRSPDPPLSRSEILRYSRHLIMPEVTLAGQKRLKGARVLCIGVGGLGSPLSLYLAAAGVGRIGLVDFDTVDLTNIQRQVLYDTEDVGRPKLTAAVERLRALNPEIEIVPHSMRLASDNVLDLFDQYDIVADGTDNFPTRYLVNDACVLRNKPNVYASIFRFEGQVSVFDASRGPCYRCLFPEPPPPGMVPSCAEGGVLGVLPGIVGSLQALEVLKLILGAGDPLIGRLVLFDALAFSIRELRVGKDPNCPVCGENPSIHAPIDYEEFCGIRGEERMLADSGIASMTVEEFKSRRDSGEGLTLIDVREPHEYEIARIDGAKLIPLGDLPARLSELDSSRTYVIHCHHGARSQEAILLMKRAGFRRLYLLSGGIDSWAERIEPSMPRY